MALGLYTGSSKLGAASNTTGSTLQVANTIGSGTTAGDSIYAVAYEKGQTTSGTMADDSGNVYSLVTSVLVNNSGTNGIISVYKSDNTVPVAHGAKFTYTKVGTSYCILALVHVAGTDPSNSVYAYVPAFGSSSAPDAVSGTPPSATCGFIGITGWVNTNRTYTTASGWTNQNGAITGTSVSDIGLYVDAIIPGTSSAEDYDPSLSGTAAWGALILTIVPPGVNGSAKGATVSMMGV